jgi:hypothetical protein
LKRNAEWGIPPSRGGQKCNGGHNDTHTCRRSMRYVLGLQANGASHATHSLAMTSPFVIHVPKYIDIYDVKYTYLLFQCVSLFLPLFPGPRGLWERHAGRRVRWEGCGAFWELLIREGARTHRYDPSQIRSPPHHTGGCGDTPPRPQPIRARAPAGLYFNI